MRRSGVRLPSAPPFRKSLKACETLVLKGLRPRLCQTALLGKPLNSQALLGNKAK